MAESFKFEGGIDSLRDAKKEFPKLQWRYSAKKAYIFDEKQDAFVPVNKGEYIVSVGDRFEVAAKPPSGRKRAEPKEAPEENNESVGQVADPTPAPEEGE